MPITENPTLVLIQREINEVAQREKELQLLKNNLSENNNNNNNDINGDNHVKNGTVINGKPSAAPILIRSQSVALLPISNESPNGRRKFTPNPAVRGFMQKFIKSRGKMLPNKTVNQKSNSQINWTMPDVVNETTRIVSTGEPVKRIRKGFVPVEERMKKELIDLQSRELELKTERRKSQSEFNSLDDEFMVEPKSNLRPVKSMMQLYNPDDDEDDIPLQSPTLKPGRSLAELCDVTDEELNTPSTLIRQWERIIKKNQEHK